MSSPSTSAIAADLVTVGEFRRLVRDDEKADLIDGVIYRGSPESRRHNEILGFLHSLVSGYTVERALGKVYFSRFAFELTEYNSPEPDLAFVRKARAQLIRDSAMEGGPDIAAEIVSRESRRRDYVDKKALYRKAGVKEYWIIDNLRGRVEFHRLRRRRYEFARLEQNRIFRSKALKGFWIDVDWLLSDPLPSAHQKLAGILAD